MIAKIIFVAVFASTFYLPHLTTRQASFTRSLLPIVKTEKYFLPEARRSSARQYALDHGLNPGICFFIDMKISSGKKRFFVYDMKNDSVILSGLVAHGSCDNGFQEEPVFSNTVNSGCSCAGKFRTGKSYYGRFGLAYKLYGLDSSNSNAYERSIVLHSYKCVPEEETQPLPICNSRGCPMVSPGFLSKLSSIIDRSDKPMLLWIFR